MGISFFISPNIVKRRTPPMFYQHEQQPPPFYFAQYIKYHVMEKNKLNLNNQKKLRYSK